MSTTTAAPLHPLPTLGAPFAGGKFAGITPALIERNGDRTYYLCEQAPSGVVLGRRKLGPHEIDFSVVRWHGENVMSGICLHVHRSGFDVLCELSPAEARALAQALTQAAVDHEAELAELKIASIGVAA